MTSTFSTISGFPEMPELPKYETEPALDCLENQSLFNMWHENSDSVIPLTGQREGFIRSGKLEDVWWLNQTARYRNENLKDKYREDLRQYEFNKKIQDFKEEKEYQRKKAEKKRLRMSFTPETEKKLMAPNAPEKKPARKRKISEKDDLMNYTESILGFVSVH